MARAPPATCPAPAALPVRPFAPVVAGTRDRSRPLESFPFAAPYAANVTLRSPEGNSGCRTSADSHTFTFESRMFTFAIPTIPDSHAGPDNGHLLRTVAMDAPGVPPSEAERRGFDARYRDAAFGERRSSLPPRRGTAQRQPWLRRSRAIFASSGSPRRWLSLSGCRHRGRRDLQIVYAAPSLVVAHSHCRLSVCQSSTSHDRDAENAGTPPCRRRMRPMPIDMSAPRRRPRAPSFLSRRWNAERFAWDRQGR